MKVHGSMTRSASSPFFFPPGGHLQTIIRSYLNVEPLFEATKSRIELPDGDFLDVEWSQRIGIKESIKNDKRATVLLLHGLEGSAGRPYMRAMANHLHLAGYQVVSLNYRGCSGEINRSKITYHAGKYDDLEQVLLWVKKKMNPETLHLVGFSLGASITLNFLIHSELQHMIRSAVAISPPLKLGLISDQLQSGIKSVYQTYFLRSLREKNLRKRIQFPDYPLFTGHTLRDFDDQVTSVVHGFESAEHYYETCSTGSGLHQIECPVQIIHAENDPICPLPIHEIQSTSNPKLEWSISKGGGHVAFLTLPDGWLGKEVVNFLKK